jgi:hypothetical protein
MYMRQLGTKLGFPKIKKKRAFSRKCNTRHACCDVTLVTPAVTNFLIFGKTSFSGVMQRWHFSTNHKSVFHLHPSEVLRRQWCSHWKDLKGKNWTEMRVKTIEYWEFFLKQMDNLWKFSFDHANFLSPDVSKTLVQEGKWAKFRSSTRLLIHLNSFRMFWYLKVHWGYVFLSPKFCFRLIQ